MLVEPDVTATPYRPPSVEELSRAEREHLRSTLSRAVDGWDGAAETGLQLDRIRVVAEADDPGRIEGSVQYTATGSGMALCLSPKLCAALVCVGLGVASDDGDGPLTATDLAVLDLWARSALRSAALALEVGKPGAVTRSGGIAKLFEADGTIVCEFRFKAGGEESAAFLAVERGLIRPRDRGHCGALAEHAELLLGVSVPVEAIIEGPALPVRELLGIEAGDVLLLGSTGRTRTWLLAGETQLTAGRPGVKSGRRAVRLTGTPAGEQRDTIDEWGADDGI